MKDTPQTFKRRQREKKTISQMVAIYCRGNHPAESRTASGFCGEAVCNDCLALDEYTILRTERCRKMEVKTSCEECGNHCYEPARRQEIREVMRYAGPRMITAHPIAAIRHLLKR